MYLKIIDMQDNCLKHNSEISQTARLYFRSKVNDSTIGDKAVVGDESRVTSSKLGEYVRIDRNNLIYHSEIGRYTYTGPFDMIFNRGHSCQNQPYKSV